MSKLQNAIVGGVRTAIGYVPTSWLPGATPDPLIDKRVNLGTQQSRVDGPDKVQGRARFAAEVKMERLLYASCVHSTIARGRIAGPVLRRRARVGGNPLFELVAPDARMVYVRRGMKCKITAGLIVGAVHAAQARFLCFGDTRHL